VTGQFQRNLGQILGPTVRIPWNCEACVVTTLPVISFFLQRQLCVVIVDASVLYLIKYFTLFAAMLDLLSFEIVIEDSEVFYLFLLAKK
jgi:uncharacterized membrane protein YjjP (DUF1212 family)